MALLLGASLAALSVLPAVLGHGHVSNVVINGVYYQGYDPTSYPYMTNPPTVFGWTAADTDNGFVAPDAYGGADIICHKNATPGGAHVTVAAGSSISIQWDTWPVSHHGPVIDYLANCNGNCETVDKTTLQFFRIDGVGWINGTNTGVWASDVLIADNFTWMVQIPANIAPGNYVLRHEMIALHGGQSLDGAQNYPQCFNLAITGTGTQKPSGTYGTALYQETDPGILFNLYTSWSTYVMPGPTLISGASSSVNQVSSTATATGSATVPGAATTSTTVKSTSVTTTTGATTTSTTVKSTTSTSATSTVVTTTAAATGTQTKYGQCGGSGWTGPTACVAGSTCSTLNAYYYQCV